MDVCAWDWGAIATFTGAGVAIFISYQWRSQKGSDLVANISREIIKDLLETMTILLKLEADEPTNVIVIDSALSLYEMKSHTAIRNLLYLTSIIKDEILEKELETLGNESSKIYMFYTEISNAPSTLYFKQSITEFKKLNNLYNVAVENIINRIKDYSTYQKPIKFTKST